MGVLIFFCLFIICFFIYKLTLSVCVWRWSCISFYTGADDATDDATGDAGDA